MGKAFGRDRKTKSFAGINPIADERSNPLGSPDMLKHADRTHLVNDSWRWIEELLQLRGFPNVFHAGTEDQCYKQAGETFLISLLHK